MSAIVLKWKLGAGASSYEVWRATTNSSGAASLLASGVTGNTYEDSSAVEGTTYYYFIRSVGPAGTSGFSASSGALTAGKTLAPPENVLATMNGIGQIVLTWDAVSGATGYDVYRYTSDAFGSASVVASSVGATTWTHTGATIDTLYVYWVVAKDGSGHSSARSLAAGGFSAPAVPSAPTGFSASDDQYAEVDLAWTAAARATSYEIWRNTTNSTGTATKIGETTGVTFVDGTGTWGTTYYYWVKAKNYSGASSFSTGNSGVAIAPPPPSAPTGVNASDGLSGYVEITWTPVSGTDIGYKVYRNTSNTTTGATLISGSTPLTDASFVDGTISTESVYYYWVKAVGVGGTSVFSTSDGGFAYLLPPSAPTGVTASEGLLGYVHIEWSSVAGADITYALYRNSSATSVGATLLASGLTDLEYDDESLTDEATYYYFVKATNFFGTSGFSTGDSGYADLGILDTPGGVSASDGDFGATTITWDAVTDATSYSVWRSTTSDFSSATQIASGITDTSYDDTTGAHEVIYYYSVKAHSSTSSSDFGGVDTGYREYAAPAAPTGVSATESDGPPIAITWTASAYASTYSVHRNTSNTTSGATTLASGITGTSYNDTTAAAGVVYYYWVKATNVVGTSGFSSSDAGSYSYGDIDGVSVTGGDAGLDVTYYMAAGVLHYDFDAQTVMDRLQIYHNGTLITDTGCISGTASSNIGPLGAGAVRVVVIPNCDGVSTGTGWSVSFSY